MKKLYLVVLFFMFVHLAMAQKSSFRFGTGYHFSTAGQTLLNINLYNNYASSSRKVDASLGRGIRLTAGYQHWLRSWFGFAVDVDYARTAPPVKGSTHTNSIDYNYSEETKWKSDQFFIIPSMVFKIAGNKLNPWASFGVIVPAYGRLRTNVAYTTSGFGPGQSGISKRTVTVKHTLGASSSLGIAPSINKHLTFFTALQIRAISIQAKKMTTTSDLLNGVEQIDTYSRSAKETIYVRKLKYQLYDSDQPRKETGYSLPFSSVGIIAGLQINL
ncbi:MAG TPA: hypothetical protein VK644_06665 [Chitinophagaceae bacterium]|nr:hypothetical protein [Chitinophagaceae bacterium]